MAKTAPLIDASVFIEALKKDKKSEAFIHNLNRFYYSVATRKELFQKKGLSRTEETAIEDILSKGIIIFLNTAILEGVRILKPVYHKKNIKDINDIIVAATALAKNLPLATLNKKHFSFIKGLKLIKL